MEGERARLLTSRSDGLKFVAAAYELYIQVKPTEIAFSILSHLVMYESGAMMRANNQLHAEQ